MLFSEARAPANVQGTSAAGQAPSTERSEMLSLSTGNQPNTSCSTTAGLTLLQSRHTEGYSSPKPLLRPRGELKPFILLCSCFARQEELYYGFHSVLTERQLNSLRQFLGWPVKAIDYFDTVSPNPSNKKDTAAVQTLT